jgi:DNA-binding NarL/FixJ family response regulator
MAAHRAPQLSVLVITSNESFADRIREGLRDSAQITLSVCGAPRKKMELAELLADSDAKVVVVDAELLGSGRLSPQHLVESGLAGADVLLLFERVGESAIHLSLSSHAHGCLEFDISPEGFAHAVDAVANGGELWFPRWMMEPFYDLALDAIVQRDRQEAKADPGTVDFDLTGREIEVIRLVRRGLTNKEVAKQLGISPSTVKKHLHNVLAKHGIHRRRQLFK